MSNCDCSAADCAYCCLPEEPKPEATALSEDADPEVMQAWRQELTRLRSLSGRGLLSMAQVDWLFNVIEQSRQVGKELIAERNAERDMRCSANLAWQTKYDEACREMGRLRAKNASLRSRPLFYAFKSRSERCDQLEAENASLLSDLERANSELESVSDKLNTRLTENARQAETIAKLREALSATGPFIRGWFAGYPDPSIHTAQQVLDKLEEALKESQ